MFCLTNIISYALSVSGLLKALQIIFGLVAFSLAMVVHEDYSAANFTRLNNTDMNYEESYSEYAIIFLCATILAVAGSFILAILNIFFSNFLTSSSLLMISKVFNLVTGSILILAFGLYAYMMFQITKTLAVDENSCVTVDSPKFETYDDTLVVDGADINLSLNNDCDPSVVPFFIQMLIADGFSFIDANFYFIAICVK